MSIIREYWSQQDGHNNVWVQVIEENGEIYRIYQDQNGNEWTEEGE